MVNEFSSLIYYDAEGRIDYYDYIGAYASSSGVNDWSTTYRISFLNDGRLNGFSLDAKSNITTETATASVHFTYDKYNRPTSKAYTYSAPSQSFTGSASYTYTDTAISTSSQVATYTSTVGSSTVTSTYTYDGNGFITKITLSTGAEYRYVYDDLGQLLREDNTVTNKTYVYEYDDAGNITSKKTYFLTAEGATPTSPISTITYGYTDPLGWGDLLTSYRGVTITYDAIGNPLTYYNGNSYTFEWENGRQLAAVSSDDLELEFAYNDEGIRTQKIANGAVHTYHLSGSQIISEEWGNHLLVYLYDSNGSPMGMQYRRSSMAEDVFYTFWFEKNLQGDIVAVYNSAGTKVVSYAYDAWGNCIVTNHNITGNNLYATFNPFRYRGYYYDSELGFYYLNSRYYDPSVGRFINADALISTGQGILGYNMFAYCGNNPVMRLDPYGSSYQKIVPAFDNGISIVSSALKATADNFASAASKLTPTSICGGGVYVYFPNQLSTQLIARSNKIQAVSDALGTVGYITTAFCVGMEMGETAKDIYDNINNDELSLGRKITDSLVDYYVCSFSTGLPIAAGIIGGALGGPVVGSLSSIGVDYLLSYLFDNTNLVDNTKNALGNLVDDIH